MICSKCKKNETRNKNQRYCNCCHAAAARERRKNVAMSEIERLKSNCRSYLHVYVKRGKVIKSPCSICGCEKVEAHHHDYSKPLDVIWLCRKHHVELHQKK